MRDCFLLREDFSRFPIGDFPYDTEHSAMGEYHLYRVPGETYGWFDPVCNYNYRGPSWIITEDEGKHYMEQMRVPAATAKLLLSENPLRILQGKAPVMPKPLLL
jgi:hypothetical protein